MTNTTITRRTLAKSAAWTVPVVAMGAAAPAASASQVIDPVALAAICKCDPHNHGNGKDVHLVLSFHHGLFVSSITVGSVIHQVNRAVMMGMTSFVVRSVPNGELRGPNTPVEITYVQDGEVHHDLLEHGPIKDCNA